MDRRSFCRRASALALSPLPTLVPLWPLAARAAQASAGFPIHPIRVISPYAPGGGPDVQLRQAAPSLGEILGQNLVIENKVGAGGVLAAIYVAQQPPNGYTLLLGSNTHIIQKAIQPDLQFDPIADFAPVSNLTSSPTVLVVNAESRYMTLEDLVSDAKARPGVLNYGSGGIGTAAHLAGATLAYLCGIKVTHIPLKGSVEIAASLLRGDTEFAFPVAGTAVPQVKGGRLRPLAVTSRARLKELPQVPTLDELLHNELAIQESWFGIWAPARTPPDVLLTLNAAVRQAAGAPALQAAYEAVGNQATPSESPQAFAAFVRSETRKWTDIVKIAGATGS